jgi:hypothetical protein
MHEGIGGSIVSPLALQQLVPDPLHARITRQAVQQLYTVRIRSVFCHILVHEVREMGHWLRQPFGSLKGVIHFKDHCEPSRGALAQ